MDTQQLQNDKLDIINWISRVQDYSLVEKVKSIMTSSNTCLLSNEQKKAIDDALHSIETKECFPHLYNRYK